MCQRLQKPEKFVAKKGVLKVLRQGQAEQQPHRAGNLRIAGEVEIQLKGIKHSGQHQRGAAVAAGSGEHLVHQQASTSLTATSLKRPSASSRSACTVRAASKRCSALSWGSSAPAGTSGA